MLLFLTIPLTITVKANSNGQTIPDTIDYWKIKLNGKVILPSQLKSGTKFFLDSISDKDTLDISYFTDTPGDPSSIEFKDGNGKIILTISRDSDYTPFQLIGKKLKKLFTDTEDVGFYYIENGNVSMLGVLTLRKPVVR